MKLRPHYPLKIDQLLMTHSSCLKKIQLKFNLAKHYFDVDPDPCAMKHLKGKVFKMFIISSKLS